MERRAPLIIVGGGLAGSLAALVLAEQRPDLKLLLVEGGSNFGGDHIWSFFDTDVPPALHGLVSALNPVRWPQHRVRFPTKERLLTMPYNAITSASLDALLRRSLPARSWLLNAKVAQITPSGVTLSTGEHITASGIIDARGPGGSMPGLELGWQKFVGIEFGGPASEVDCATVMDATVPQLDGYRFVYVLPFAADRILIEDTYYADTPGLDIPRVTERVRNLAQERGLTGPELRHESGVLPILIGGKPERFWPAGDPIARLGLRGGFFHATTGYSFGLALQLAAELAGRNGTFDSAALAEWSRKRFFQHWSRMRFFRMLNRMLFHASHPDQRHRIFAHFYRLPDDLVARFYAGELRITDHLRILSGRPPVGIGEAIRALTLRRRDRA